jgi:hypothetical protein
MNNDARAQLLHAFRIVLKPLVRILLRAGLRFDEFIEFVKAIYVEVAARDLLARKDAVSPGRVSLITGVPRRNVQALFASNSWNVNPGPTAAPALAAILNRWHTDSAYLGPYGVPVEIPVRGRGPRSFEMLVAGSPISIDPDFALEQLLAANVVVRSGDNFLKVTTREYVVPEPLSGAMLEHFGNSMMSLASTLEYNMNPANDQKRLERSVFPDGGLPHSLIPEFESYMRERAKDFLAEVDDWLASARRKAKPDSGPPVTTGVSLFHYVKQKDPEIDLTRFSEPDGS